MEIDEATVLQHLHKAFPDGVIYKDEYSFKKHIITVPLDMNIWKLAKAQGLTREQWLQKKGFIWKIVGYIEPDMRHKEGVVNNNDAFLLADSIFQLYPLAGEYELSNTEATKLFLEAQCTVQKMTIDYSRISPEEETVLTLETIELLKYWSGDLTDDEVSGSFWNYIYLQYGFNPENSDSAATRLYNRFCAAVRNTLTRYHRFFAPVGTQRYYTSLLLHAISPVRSIEALFNILFDFYTKNLDFQYVPDDVSYKVFTRSMCARWDGEAENKDNVSLKSDVVCSGLKTLFSQRPGFMASICDTLVRKMDLLLRGQAIYDSYETQNYWDSLLLEWYRKKSGTERVRAQGERRQRNAEFVATTEDRIYMQYALEHDHVGIIIPRIRLQETGTRRPIVRLFQGEKEVHTAELSVTGNDLCLTTQKCFIPLSKTDIDFNKTLSIRGEIEYMGSVIFESRQKLVRQYIIFNSAGDDRETKSGDVFLFAGKDTSVEFNGDSGVFQYSAHPGQLYGINLDEVSSVAIDGVEIFADDATVSQFRSHASKKAIPGLHVLSQGRLLDIYAEPFSLVLRLPEGEPSVRYQLSVDGARYRVSEFQQNDGAELEIEVDTEDCLPHSLKVIDISSDIVKYEYDYIVLPGFFYQLDKQLYIENEQEFTLSISFMEKQFNISAMRKLGLDSAQLSCTYNDLEFEVDVPTVHCTFLGQNAFSSPESVWYKDIPNGEFVQLQLPSGWNGKLILGTRAVPVASIGNGIELGNELRSAREFSPEEALWISLKSEHGNAERVLLTTIIFEPKFLDPPLNVVGERLEWHAEFNYIGEADPHFLIEFTLPDSSIKKYSAICKDDILEECANLPHGRYPYRIFIHKQGVFDAGENKQIYSGTFTIGNENEFAFDGKEIFLENARYWDLRSDSMKDMQMKPRAGIIQNMAYIGNTIASGESIAAPEYEAKLLFENSYGKRIAFNYEESDVYETVNPVHVWIVNERVLILKCFAGDAVYIDTQRSFILNRSPDTVMSKTAQRNRLQIPDYFEYKTEEV